MNYYFTKSVFSSMSSFISAVTVFNDLDFIELHLEISIICFRLWKTKSNNNGNYNINQIQKRYLNPKSKRGFQLFRFTCLGLHACVTIYARWQACVIYTIVYLDLELLKMHGSCWTSTFTLLASCMRVLYNRSVPDMGGCNPKWLGS